MALQLQDFIIATYFPESKNSLFQQCNFSKVLNLYTTTCNFFSGTYDFIVAILQLFF